ncbi:hypothetical protein ACFW1M_14750 [Streptomyces inhibens]|uniref:hypothetical protein n=1 Tax=Streptomyces inhibens TaxID=2293571 RepID=UPI0036BAD47F
MIRAAFGPATKGETDYAHDLVGHLTSDILLLADRAFDSNELLADIAAQGISSWCALPASGARRSWRCCPTAPT